MLEMIAAAVINKKNLMQEIKQKKEIFWKSFHSMLKNKDLYFFVS